MTRMVGRAEQRAAVAERLGARLEQLADLIHGVSRPESRPDAPEEEKPPEGAEPEQPPSTPKVIRGQIGGVAGPIVIGVTLALK